MTVPATVLSVLVLVVMFVVVSISVLVGAFAMVLAVMFSVLSGMVLAVMVTVLLALSVVLSRVVAPVVDHLGHLAESISHLVRLLAGIHGWLGRLHICAHNAGGSGQRDENYQCDDQSGECWLHWVSPHILLQPVTGYPYG